MIEFLKEIGIPEDAYKEYTCPKHQTTSHINEYCETCEIEMNELVMIEKTKRLALAQIDPEFHAFGVDFSIEDFDPNTEDRKKAKKNILNHLNETKEGNPRRRGMVLYGEQGNGKSMLSNLFQ